MISDQIKPGMEVAVDIPIEIIRCMLLKLTVKALIRCQSVCKEWRSTIQDDPDFKLSYRGGRRVVAANCDRRTLGVTSITNTLQVSEYSSSYLSTTFHPQHHGWPWSWSWSGVWCSCNGLVLISLRQHILLWNPSTRCCTKVLELRGLRLSWHDDVVSGLCYVPSTGDYKAVVFLLSEPTSTVFVASLKNKEWRKVLFPYNAVRDNDGGVNFHNTFHWRVRDGDSNKIVYFDPGSDEFKELPIPNPGGESSEILGMGIIDECFCVARQGKEIRGSIQVLVMKEYGVEKSWVTEFVIPPTNFNGKELICDYRNITLYSSKCNTKVLICNRLFVNSWEILVYDLKNSTLDIFYIQLEFQGDLGICSYVQSIVSPHEFIWRGNDDQHNHTPAQNDAALLRSIFERFSIS